MATYHAGCLSHWAVRTFHLPVYFFTFTKEQEVSTVEEFVYLGALVHSPTHSFPDIMRLSAFTHTAMQSLDKHLWQSKISLSTKLRLYNTCILPIFLYGSECWAITMQGRRTQDQCPPSMVFPYTSRHQVVSLHLQR